MVVIDIQESSNKTTQVTKVCSRKVGEVAGQVDEPASSSPADLIGGLWGHSQGGGIIRGGSPPYNEVAGVLSEEVVLQRGLQELPAGAGWYVLHCTSGAGGSGAGSWEDRSALFTASAYSSDVELCQRVEL